MEVFVLRHGDAQPRREDLAEADRKLTPKGMRDVERVFRFARARGVKPDLVLTSPYLRALKTAQIAVALLDPKPVLQTVDDLLPNIRPEQVWNLLRSQSRYTAVMLVGHEPQLSHLIGYLLACLSLRLDLKKSSLVRIRMDAMSAQPHGELKWIITPALARAVRRVRAGV